MVDPKEGQRADSGSTTCHRGPMEPDATANESRADLLAHVEHRLVEVSTSLDAATGGQALCRLDGATGSAKSLEGRSAALLEVRRVLRKDPHAPFTGVAQRWASDLASRRARSASAAWLEYLEGGVAELAALEDWTSSAQSGQPPPHPGGPVV